MLNHQQLKETDMEYITHETLEDLGLSDDNIDDMMNGFVRITWPELAKQDGQTALLVLSDADFAKVTAELVSQGLAPQIATDRIAVAAAILDATRTLCPTGAWYSRSLHTAVACASLMALVQTALEPKQEESGFAKRLGVDTKEVKLILPEGAV